MNSKKNYIEKNLNLIKSLISENRPKFEIARVLGVKYSTLNKYLKAFGIEYNGNQPRKGFKRVFDRKPIETYLREDGPYISASRLRQKLIESGLKEERCEMCKNTEWMGKKIPLELHHINMNHFDNRLENLQVLCSNCHMVIHDYCNVKKAEKKPKPKMEKKPKEKKVAPSSRRPEKDELYRMLCENNFTYVAKMYGVTDNAVRKWCDFYKIPRSAKYYKKIRTSIRQQ